MTVACDTRSSHVGRDVTTDFCGMFPTFAFLFGFPCRLDAACGGESFVERATGRIYHIVGHA